MWKTPEWLKTQDADSMSVEYEIESKPHHTTPHHTKPNQKNKPKNKMP
jgi:hypothetical protein